MVCVNGKVGEADVARGTRGGGWILTGASFDINTVRSRWSCEAYGFALFVVTCVLRDGYNLLTSSSLPSFTELHRAGGGDAAAHSARLHAAAPRDAYSDAEHTAAGPPEGRRSASLATTAGGHRLHGRIELHLLLLRVLLLSQEWGLLTPPQLARAARQFVALVPASLPASSS